MPGFQKWLNFTIIGPLQEEITQLTLPLNSQLSDLGDRTPVGKWGRKTMLFLQSFYSNFSGKFPYHLLPPGQCHDLTSATSRFYNLSIVKEKISSFYSRFTLLFLDSPSVSIRIMLESSSQFIIAGSVLLCSGTRVNC